MIKDTAIENISSEDFNIGNYTTPITRTELSIAILKEYEDNKDYYNLPAQSKDLEMVREAEIYLDELSNKN